MGRTLASLLVLGLAATAFAAPTMEVANIADLGGGLYGVDVWVHGNDGLDLSFFADMTFVGEQADPICLPGEIQQSKAFGVVVVDDDVNALLYHNTVGSGYDMALDSYFFEPFPGNKVDPGIVEAPNSYHIEAGTGTSEYFQDVQLVYLCTTGDISYDGYISRQGLNYDMAGTWCIPEPATLGLIVIGGVALIRRRRR